MNSSKNRKWKVYSALTCSDDGDGDGDCDGDLDQTLEVQPSCAFIVTNGSDECSLLLNDGEYVFDFVSKKTSTQISTVMSKKNADLLSKSLHTHMQTNTRVIMSENKHGKYQPINKIAFDANVVTLGY